MKDKLNILENKYLNFELGEEQRAVLLSIFYFISDESKERCCTLDGFSGSGKTTLTRLIVNFLEEERIGYVLAAPTHKAKGVLSMNTEREATTIHKLLSLSPNIDIRNLDYKDLKFTSKTIDTSIPGRGVLIIDECSMVNEVLFDHIVDRAKDRNCKVIWIGDYAQICPVKEGKLSKAFSISNVFKLTKVYRQKDDNPLLDVFYDLRSNPIYKFNQINSQQGSLIKYNDWRKFISETKYLFQQMIQTENPNLVKLIAYTNKRVEAFNSIIRSQLFDNTNEYNIGDILTGYDSCEYKVNTWMGYDIINSCDYIIRNVHPTKKQLGYKLYNGYDLKLYSCEDKIEFTVFIVSRENSEQDFNILAAHIESLRLNAVECRNQKRKNILWVQYFKFMGSFLCPYDLSFDGRIVRRKSLDYGYCITSHKSQGSTYDTVLVDMDNIFRCYNKLELRQLQYVAMSRTRKDIYMLIKN